MNTTTQTQLSSPAEQRMQSMRWEGKGTQVCAREQCPRGDAEARRTASRFPRRFVSISRASLRVSASPRGKIRNLWHPDDVATWVPFPSRLGAARPGMTDEVRP
jgi:hypothetical protein